MSVSQRSAIRSRPATRGSAPRTPVARRSAHSRRCAARPGRWCPGRRARSGRRPCRERAGRDAVRARRAGSHARRLAGGARARRRVGRELPEQPHLQHRPTLPAPPPACRCAQPARTRQPCGRSCTSRCRPSSNTEPAAEEQGHNASASCRRPPCIRPLGHQSLPVHGPSCPFAQSATCRNTAIRSSRSSIPSPGTSGNCSRPPSTRVRSSTTPKGWNFVG